MAECLDIWWMWIFRFDFVLYTCSFLVFLAAVTRWKACSEYNVGYAYSSQFTAISSALGFVFNFHLSALTQKLLTWWFGIFFPPVLRRFPFTSDNWSRIWKLLSLYVHAPWCFLKTCVGNEGALPVRARDKSKGRKRRTPLKWHFRYVSDIQILMWFLFTSQELVFTCL